MKISIIIASYNEEKDLKECIKSLAQQNGEDFEIIVIDDGSVDNTGPLIAGLSKRVPNLIYLKQNHNGAGAARNLGAKVATGQILVFVDADMTFDKNFIKKLVEPIKRGLTKGSFSKSEYVSNWDNIWARCWNFNEGWEIKRRHPKNFPDHQPVFRAILRNEFEKIGGFTPGGYDDDWSLSIKLGYEAINAPNAVLYHKNPSTLSEIFDQAKWVGKRRYKLGLIGCFIGLMRTSLPVSIAIGLFKSIKFKTPQFIVFKIIYDFGIFLGILNFLMTGKSSK